MTTASPAPTSTPPAKPAPSSDPSDTGITGAFVAAFHDYLARALDYQDRPFLPADLLFPPASNGTSTTRARGFSAGAGGLEGKPGGRGPRPLRGHAGESAPVASTSLNGVYDLATPFFGTEYDLGHMQLDPALRRNVRFSYYPSGHMVYLNPEALKSMVPTSPGFTSTTRPRRASPTGSEDRAQLRCRRVEEDVRGLGGQVAGRGNSRA